MTTNYLVLKMKLLQAKVEAANFDEIELVLDEIQSQDVEHLKLNEFKVTKFDAFVGKNGSEVEFRFGLERLYKSYWISAFIPSMCLVFAAEVTLFIDQSHFKASVTVTLTATLATLTLYNTIQQKLPADPGLGTGTFFMLFPFL